MAAVLGGVTLQRVANELREKAWDERILELVPSGVDEGIVAENLKLSPTQRIEKVRGVLVFVEGLKRDKPSPQSGGPGMVLCRRMEASEFEQRGFFASIEASAARALLIGRQALVALGLPLVTRDYDFWLHIDDIAALNAAVQVFGLVPNRSLEDARKRGRYVLENDEHVDVLVARSCPTVDGALLAFDDVWERRRRIDLGEGVGVCIPALDDLIATKRFAARPRDAEDIRLLEGLRQKGWSG
jgi:hypothetical protein